MATKAEQDYERDNPGKSAIVPPAESQWITVEDEAPTMITFEATGEVFTGHYKGMREIVPEDESKERFDQVTFRGIAGPDNREVVQGELYGINPGYVLTRALKSVPVDNDVRLTFMKTVAIKNQPSDMNSFRVETRPCECGQ